MLWGHLGWGRAATQQLSVLLTGVHALPASVCSRIPGTLQTAPSYQLSVPPLLLGSQETVSGRHSERQTHVLT